MGKTDRDRLQGRKHSWENCTEIIEGLGLIHVNDSRLTKIGKKVKVERKEFRKT